MVQLNILIILITIVKISGLVYLKDHQRHKHIRRCVLNLFHTIVEDILVIPFRKLDDEYTIFDATFISQLTSVKNITVVTSDIITLKVESVTSKHRSIYLVEFKDILDLESLISVGRKQELWNTDTKFIVAAKFQPISEQKLLSRVIEKLSSNSILNFVILLQSIEMISQVDIFSWFPFANNNCMNNYSNVEKIGTYIGTLKMHKDPFFNKKPPHYRNCVMKAIVIVWPPYVEYLDILESGSQILGGIQVNVLNLIADKLKFRIHYLPQYHNWGKIFPNGSHSGSMSSLVTEQVDLAAGGYGVSPLRLEYLDVSSSHMMESIMWVVPSAKMVPHSRLVIDGMYFANYISLYILFFVFSILLALFNLALKNESLIYRDPLNILVAMFCFSVNSPVNILPKTSRIRILCMAYILHSLYTRILYDTYLTTSMTHPYFQQQIDSLDDILEKNMKLVISMNIDRYILGDVEEQVAKKILSQGWTSCQNFSSCLSDVAYSETSAFAAPRYNFEYFSGHYLDNNSSPLLYPLKNNLAILPVHLLMRRNYFMTDQVDSVLLRILAAGFVEYWIQGVNFKTRKRTKPTFMLKLRPIISQDLRMAFIFLAAGLVVACVVFVLELINHYQLLHTFAEKFRTC